MRTGENPAGPRRRGPRRASPRYLRNAALHYLERYASSSEHLRRLLLRKVERSARAHGTDPLDGARTVDALIEDFTRLGLLDDARYAEAKVRALFRKGASARAIRAALAAKGVDPDVIVTALAKREESAREPELIAALRFARRRRIGPYRTPRDRAPMRERDLAMLGRRGFEYEVARRVVEAPSAQEIEAEADANHGTLT